MFDLKPIERKVDCAFEESEHQTQCETGMNGRAKCHLRLLCQGAVMGVSLSTASAQLKVLGGLFEDQDGVGGVGMEPA